MIKVRTGEAVILGIDRENIKRLKEHKPIRINGMDVGINVDIYIVYGERLKDISKMYNLPTAQ